MIQTTRIHLKAAWISLATHWVVWSVDVRDFDGKML